MKKYIIPFFFFAAVVLLFSCKKADETSKCNDGILNNNEVAIDCGGSCQVCPNYYLRGTLDSNFFSIAGNSISQIYSDDDVDTVGYPSHCTFSDATELSENGTSFRITVSNYIGCDSIIDDIRFRKALFKTGYNDIIGNGGDFFLIAAKDSAYFQNSDYYIAYGGTNQTGSSLNITNISDIMTDNTGQSYFEIEGEVTCKLYPYGITNVYHQLTNAKFKLAVK